jgi:hypothetical protein
MSTTAWSVLQYSYDPVRPVHAGSGRRSAGLRGARRELDARHAAQRTSLKGPAAKALAVTVQSVFEGGAYR